MENATGVLEQQERVREAGLSPRFLEVARGCGRWTTWYWFREIRRAASIFPRSRPSYALVFSSLLSKH
jgi:hypothetical protein